MYPYIWWDHLRRNNCNQKSLIQIRKLQMAMKALSGWKEDLYRKGASDYLKNIGNKPNTCSTCREWIKIALTTNLHWFILMKRTVSLEDYVEQEDDESDFFGQVWRTWWWYWAWAWAYWRLNMCLQQSQDRTGFLFFLQRAWTGKKGWSRKHDIFLVNIHSW